MPINDTRPPFPFDPPPKRPPLHEEDEELMEQLWYAPIWGALLCLMMVAIGAVWQWRRYKMKYDRSKRGSGTLGSQEEMLKQILVKYTAQEGAARPTYTSPDLSHSRSSVNDQNGVSPLLTFEPSSSSSNLVAANSHVRPPKRSPLTLHINEQSILSNENSLHQRKGEDNSSRSGHDVPDELLDLYSPSSSEAQPAEVPPPMLSTRGGSSFPVSQLQKPRPVLASMQQASLAGGLVRNSSHDKNLHIPLPRAGSNNQLLSPGPSPSVGVPKVWQRGQLLGSGSYGNVYMGVRVNGTFFAAKVIALNDTLPTERLIELKREVELMSYLQHENIVRYFGCNIEKEELVIFMECVQGGSLGALVRRHGQNLEELPVASYTRQILAGVHYLHDHSIIHRDLKGDNILIGEAGCIKLTDFGTSKKINETRITHLQGTPLWMSPEAIKGHLPITLKADIWSVGCVVCELLDSGRPPWPSEWESSWQALYTIGNWTKPLPPDVPEDLSETTMDFLRLCFRIVPEERSSAAQLQHHAFITQSTDENLEKSMLGEDYTDTPTQGSPFRKSSSQPSLPALTANSGPVTDSQDTTYGQAMSTFAFGDKESRSASPCSSEEGRGGSVRYALASRRKSSYGICSDGDGGVRSVRSVADVLTDMIQASTPKQTEGTKPSGLPPFAVIAAQQPVKRNVPEPDWIRTASSFGGFDDDDDDDDGGDVSKPDDSDEETEAQHAGSKTRPPLHQSAKLPPSRGALPTTPTPERREEEVPTGSSPTAHSPLLAARVLQPHSPLSPVLKGSPFSATLAGSSPDTDIDATSMPQRMKSAGSRRSSLESARLEASTPNSGRIGPCDMPERQFNLLSPTGNPSHLVAAVQCAEAVL